MKLKDMVKQIMSEDIMDKEIKNPKTGNKIKVRTALQLPGEHPANKMAKKLVAKSPSTDDEPMDATPAPKGEPKGPMKNPFSKESPAFEPKQKQIDKEQERIDLAFQRIQPAIDQQNKIIADARSGDAERTKPSRFVLPSRDSERNHNKF